MTHTVEQARAAARMPVDYIAFGPVFPTRTKADPDRVVGLDVLYQIREIVHPIPLVAIGGIEPRARRVASLGDRANVEPERGAATTGRVRRAVVGRGLRRRR